MLHQNEPLVTPSFHRSTDDRVAIVGSLGIHIGGLALLWVLSVSTPSPEEEIIAVELASAAALGDPKVTELNPASTQETEPDTLPPPLEPTTQPPEPVVPPPKSSLSISQRERKEKPKKRTQKPPQKVNTPAPPPQAQENKKSKKKRVRNKKTPTPKAQKKARKPKANPFATSPSKSKVNPFAPAGGNPKGSEGGEGPKGIGAIYLHKIRNVISRRFLPPPLLNKKKLKSLKTVIEVKLEKNTHKTAYIKSHKILKKSGVRDFDLSAERAIKLFYRGGNNKLPLPNGREERKLLLNQKLILEMKAH